MFFTGYPHTCSICQPYAMELTGWGQGPGETGVRVVKGIGCVAGLYKEDNCHGIG